MARRNPAIPALAAATLVCAALAVLYVIRSSPVHDARPAVLSALTADSAPKPAPDAPFADAGGKPRSLAAFKGRFVILNLWATWCAPCVRELPALGALAAALDPKSVVVVAVNAGHDSAADTAKFLKAHGAGDLAAYRDPDLSLLTAFGSQGLPFSVLIDPAGRAVAHASGPLPWDDPAAIAYFKSLTARAAPHP